jgi:ADP-heptose:LPS heptosyltransferase
MGASEKPDYQLKRHLTSLLLRLLALLGPRKLGPLPNAEIRRIVVLRFGGIGDVVALTGLIRTLRQVYADAGITLVTSPYYAPVVNLNPDIERIILSEKICLTSSLRKNLEHFLKLREISTQPYDLAFFTHNDFYSLFFAFFLSARYKIGFDTNDRGFDFALTHSAPIYTGSHPLAKRHESHHINEHFHNLLKVFHGKEIFPNQSRIFLHRGEIEKTRAWLTQRNLRSPLLVLVPGGTEAIKIWPIDRFAQLAEWCTRELDVSVLVLGGKGEAKYFNWFGHIGSRVHFAAGQVPLRDSICLLKFADIVIGSDTGLIHAAAALDVPTITIFGPTPSSAYGYDGERNTILKANLDCIPCSRTFCRILPRTTERPVRKRGDECSGLHASVVPQSHGREPVVRGLPPRVDPGTPPCLEEIKVSDVVGEVKRLLNQLRADKRVLKRTGQSGWTLHHI